MLSVIMLSVVMLSVVMQSVIMLSVVMLSVVMLSVVMLNDVTLSVVAPLKRREEAKKKKLEISKEVFASLRQVPKSLCDCASYSLTIVS
jgi:hypothetical protein